MPAHQIPREKFVVGEGVYSSERKWEARISENVFEIVPAAIPVGKQIMIGVLVMILALSMAAYMVSQDSYIIASGIVLFGIFTTVFSLMLNAADYQSTQQRGIVFRMDRKTGEVSLPDRELTFGANCRLSFAFIISPFYSPEGTGESYVSELQLVVESNNQTDRYVLAQGGGHTTLIPLVTEVHRHVNLPIYEIEHSGFLQPKVYEKMFGLE